MYISETSHVTWLTGFLIALRKTFEKCLRNVWEIFAKTFLTLSLAGLYWTSITGNAALSQRLHRLKMSLAFVSQVSRKLFGWLYRTVRLPILPFAWPDCMTGVIAWHSAAAWLPLLFNLLSLFLQNISLLMPAIAKVATVSYSISWVLLFLILFYFGLPRKTGFLLLSFFFFPLPTPGFFFFPFLLFRF